jgi:predicted AAA+ superfamily ATPase
MKRVQKNYILKDLSKKMVFLVGPRQAGKTWLAKDIATQFPNSLYLNYDNPTDKEIIIARSWKSSVDLLILDELHKMDLWKNYLKGLYDVKPQSLNILVAGSARLDAFDRMGDSLAGRYYRHRLLPLSLSELRQVGEPTNIDTLMLRGGFPEAYLAESEQESDRWRAQYVNSLLATDVFEFDQIQNLKAMRLIFDLLRHRVGSPISYNSLSGDVGVSPAIVKKYIQILEALYIVFIVTPYSKNIARSLLKEPKIYFFDTALVMGDEGARFENLVAVSLLKNVYAKTDYEAKEYSLHYLKTKEDVEVDFAVAVDDEVDQIIEAKLSDTQASKSLTYFSTKYNYSAVQLVKSMNLRNEYKQGAVQVLKAEQFLTDLFL